MSKRTVDAVRRKRRLCVIEAHDRGAFWANDFSYFPAVYTEDVVLTNGSRLQMIIGPSPQSGIDGFARLREDLVGAARFFRFDVEELRRASGDRVVALGQLRVRSRYAGLILRTGFATVWTLRGDKICRAEAFSSRRTALRVVGLEAGSAEEGEFDESGFVHDIDDHRDLG